ncbi:hypothetical protein [Carboxylicivirga linearis]|uniref:Uncharacterized protein n=1 Tax=Carboxylicivirga linearis TaxID=1628157 RepID=A0ABS5JYZ7_9BACT|nr:hypothetical protein [Carboxylicivirga linearis]MBS2100086.1 hypothetical protein [Carboxylicivirga linearis]
MLALKRVILFLSIAFFASTVSAQCFSFAKNIGKSKLGDFVHDGNYNATILSEGEKAELFKTFFEGQKYRISISKIEQLPPIHFKLVNNDGVVLFDNKDHDYSLSWDFEVKSTQMLIVEMEVLERQTEDIISGCVAVLFGVEVEKDKKK